MSIDPLDMYNCSLPPRVESSLSPLLAWLWMWLGADDDDADADEEEEEEDDDDEEEEYQLSSAKC